MSLLTVCDTITRLFNGSLSGRDTVYVKYSKEILRILEVLKVHGYIEEYAYPCPEKYMVQVLLRYDSNGIPAIRFKRFLSTPSRPIYWKAGEQITRKFGRLSSVFISTSSGIVALNGAKKSSVGGLLLFEVGS